MNILILHDDLPESATPDQLDTLVQVNEIDGLLTHLGHRVQRLAMGKRLDDTTAMIHFMRPDLVFNLVESIWGQGRWIHLAPTILEQLGIPFAGSGANAIQVTTDKLKAKNRMAQLKLPTPAWLTWQDLPLLRENRNHWIIKSVTEHASTGLDEDSVISGMEPDRLRTEMTARRQALGGDCFAEKYIPGREFNLALLAGPDEPEILPPAEILFNGYGAEKVRVVGYRAKWDTESFEYRNTTRTFSFAGKDRRLLARLKELSRACWNLFDLHGWARVDFRVDSKGRPFILEVNANPCLSSDAGFMAAAEQAGYDPGTVVRRILDHVIVDQTDFIPMMDEGVPELGHHLLNAPEFEQPVDLM